MRKNMRGNPLACFAEFCFSTTIPEFKSTVDVPAGIFPPKERAM